MENYLHKCLDSLIVDDENLQLLEILVVNDGSKDKSSQIAHEYEAKYPQIFRIIDKENGNYGSCINRGLKEATGKYVKVLDADDYFDNRNFVCLLNNLRYADVDLVLTAYNLCYSNGTTVRHYCKLPENEIQNTSVMINDDFLNMQMHSVTYKTSILRDINYKQTEGISYTDQEWIFYPMTNVKTILYFPISVYQYQIGREGQTMDFFTEINSVGQKMPIMFRMVGFYSSSIIIDENINKYILYRLKSIIRLSYKHVLLFLTNSQYNLFKDKLIEFDLYVQSELPTIYEEMNNFLISGMLPLKFIKFWREHSAHRYPKILLWIQKRMKDIDIFLRKYGMRK